MTLSFRLPRDLTSLPSTRRLAAELTRDLPSAGQGDESAMEHPRVIAEWAVSLVWTAVAYSSAATGVSGLLQVTDASLVGKDILACSNLFRQAVARRGAASAEENPVFSILAECGVVSKVTHGFYVKAFRELNPELSGDYTPPGRIGRSAAAVKKIGIAADKMACSDLARVRAELWLKPDGSKADNTSMFRSLSLINTLDRIFRHPERQIENLEASLVRNSLSVVGEYSQAALDTILKRLHLVRSQGRAPSGTEIALKHFDKLILEIAPTEGYTAWARNQKNPQPI